MPDIRPIKAHEVRALRHAVLYPNRSLPACTYPADDRTSSVHYGALDDARLIGVLSLFHEAPEEGSALLDEAEGDAWRICAVAVDAAWRGHGVGRRLVDAARQHALEHSGRLLWCYARQGAVGFYERLGFIRGVEVQRPGADRPFRLMERTLP